MNQDLLTAWPFREAIRILNERQGKSSILLETGYGPSGLPHMGTLSEIARTWMVFNAIRFLNKDMRVKLISFSDDMDALRKIPENVPNQEILSKYIGKPLTSVPDPFEKYESFAHHNNAMLIDFLANFSIEVQFISSTETYRSGMFNDVLLQILHHHQQIIDIISPTLGEERRSTYSPFLPISPTTGKVLQVKVRCNETTGTIIFCDEDGVEKEISVLNGNCKVQWKIDWAMRWCAFEVDFEMYGKDLIDSYELSSKVCKILGKNPPIGLLCEHFLDNNGAKISKSKGNGVSVEEWLRYAPKFSLIYLIFKSPQRAKKLSFEIIPTIVDEYLKLLEEISENSDDMYKKFNNPIWHVHGGNPPKYKARGLNFSLLLNLINACNANDINILKKYIDKYIENIDHPLLDEILSCALLYTEKFISGQKIYRSPNKIEQTALIDLMNELERNENDDAAKFQHIAYETGKKHNIELAEWFKTIYQVILGQNSGPRIGNFIELYGAKNFTQLMKTRLNK
ncbi:lysine--tRNA ligase [Candidatus Gromoviella agglomerans]|uniref:lysine--tRNA ligase n=1 Tax=Candidatus Gromoviella agglomerans TaxID=2806609 RepID=UPI001E5DE1AA|nr:lysine--tRNA ligase [Candidatus Gromoviella agglomerans]UFX98521.1 Lysine--tRNA ligase [Candidatus Gromoviella agglomerans]